MRFVEKHHVYNAPWKLIVQAVQRRHSQIPNPLIPSLLKVEHYDYEFCPAQRIVQWSTRAYMKPPIPGWLQRICGLKHVRFITHVTVNYEKKEWKNVVYNEDLYPKLQVYEVITFSPCKGDPNKTVRYQESQVTVDMKLFASQAEDIIVSAYDKAYPSARKIDTEFVKQILELENDTQPNNLKDTQSNNSNDNQYLKEPERSISLDSLSANMSDMKMSDAPENAHAQMSDAPEKTQEMWKSNNGFLENIVFDHFQVPENLRRVFNCDEYMQGDVPLAARLRSHCSCTTELACTQFEVNKGLVHPKTLAQMREKEKSEMEMS